MSEKINITDINKLQITKVKTWKIHFTYDGVKYFIIDDTDEDCHISLYRREPLENGGFNNILINGIISSASICQFIRDISKSRPRNTTYSCIDKQFFIKKLLELEFSSGLFEKEYNEYQDKTQALNLRRMQIEQELREAKTDWYTTSNHGSKTDQLQHKFKLKACERIKGAKDDDYCEEFNAPYGSTSDEYGGTLIDLFNLPFGTYFYVNNGCYTATIGYDEHGDKTIITPVSVVTLTEKHHSAYISEVQQTYNKEDI